MASKSTGTSSATSLHTSPWESESIENAIHRIAEADHLVLLVGAGVSINRGIPGWRSLLEQLVQNALKKSPGLSRKQRSSLASALLSESDDLMATAQFIGGLKGDEWVSREIARIFYSSEVEQTSEDYLTGLSFVIVARFLAGLETTVISTNFDDILEREVNQSIALEGEISLAPVYDPTSVQEVAAWQGDDESIFPVYHIHGFLAKDGRRTPIVLTLEQFAAIDDSHWTEVLLREVQAADVWLSVGMSLTDLHVLRHVLRRSQRAPDMDTFALMARHSRNDHRADSDVFFYLENAITDGYTNLGVTPLFMNWYGELAMFLDEVFLFTGSKPSGVPASYSFKTRRDAWMERVASANSRTDSGGLGVREKNLSRALRSRQESVSEFVRRHFPASEVIKVEYWELDTRMEVLSCIASSDGVKYHESTRPTLRLEALSNWAAAQAIQSNLVSAIEDGGTSRWQTFSAWPVRLWAPPHYGIPVGALVFSSASPKGTSGLVGDDRVEETLRGAVVTMAEAVAKSAPRVRIGSK